MSEYTSPGIYLDEIPHFPPSITATPTDIAVFIGYTQKAKDKTEDDLLLKPILIQSILEYERFFGKAAPETGITVDFVNTNSSNVSAKATLAATIASPFLLYYSLQFFFANGGHKCYIVSVNTFEKASGISVSELEKGLEESGKIDQVTLITIPESINIKYEAAAVSSYYALWEKAMQQCAQLLDRFAVFDLYPFGSVDDLRNSLSNDVSVLRFGAVYYPRLFTTIDYYYSDESAVAIRGVNGATTLAQLKTIDNNYYTIARAAISSMEMLLPASPAVVAQYIQTDRNRGVWKAPANINITLATRPEVPITDRAQQDLNVHDSGKSINVIRSFTGRGVAIIWGARTLAGNDNEWRYIPVRRFFSFVEESIKTSTEQFVFEPNDANTWVRITALVQNFLTLQWRFGALMGATTKDAFFVRVGLRQTMTELDLLEGRMIIEIGMAVVRPAEFIILRFMHKMLSET